MESHGEINEKTKKEIRCIFFNYSKIVKKFKPY